MNRRWRPRSVARPRASRGPPTATDCSCWPPIPVRTGWTGVRARFEAPSPTPDPDRAPPGRGAAATVPDRPRISGAVHGGRSTRPERVGGRLGRRRHGRCASSRAITRDPVGTRAWSRRSTCRRERRARSTTRPGRWKGWRSRRTAPARLIVEGYASDHGLLAGSVMVIDLATGETTDPWPDLQSVGPRLVVRRRFDLVRDAPTARATRAAGIWLGRPASRNAGATTRSSATPSPRPTCAISEDAADVWTTHQAHATPPELARFDHETGRVAPSHVVQRPHRRGPRLPRRTHDPVDGRGWRRDRGRADDAARRRGAAPDDRLRARRARRGTGVRTSPIPSRTRCCSPRRATPACCRTRAAASGAATRSTRR